MSIERGKDMSYRRSRVALAVAVLFLTAALLVVLGHQAHWPVAVHGLVVIVLFAVAMVLFFMARDGDARAAGRGNSGNSEERGHGN